MAENDPLRETGLVLACNDDAASRYLLVRTLEMAGFRVLEAATGQQCLDVARAGRPDVIVLDVKLPDMNGFEVVQALRQDPDTRSIAIMNTSATFVTVEKKVYGLEKGADAYLAQPFESVELVATVKSLLRMRHAEQEAQRKAEALLEVDRRKDEFLAMLAHELRTPLAAILTSVGILERRPSPDEREARMRSIIHRQTVHLSRLVDDLLDVGRITRGRVELRRQRLELGGVLAQTLAVARATAEQRSIALTARLPDGPLWVDADPTRLEQVFTNLLDNALKYTDAGGRVDVWGRLEGGRAVVEVRDTGIGIAPEKLSQVFELFSQVVESVERSRGGLGIGLTLVQRLVALHNGHVEAHSDGPGLGSRFRVELPVPATVQLPEGRGAAALAGGAALRRRRVLVVEDDGAARGALQALLEGWGHDVQVATDGPQGLALALKGSAELALVGLGLPGLVDGFRLAEQLRRRLGPALRLVALTGGAGPAARDVDARAREAGFDLQLQKPVAPEALARVLAELEDGAPSCSRAPPEGAEGRAAGPETR